MSEDKSMEDQLMDELTGLADRLGISDNERRELMALAASTLDAVAEEAHKEGKDQGYKEGHQEGVDEGYEDGESTGYDQGYQDAKDEFSADPEGIDGLEYLDRFLSSLATGATTEQALFDLPVDAMDKMVRAVAQKIPMSVR